MAGLHRDYIEITSRLHRKGWAASRWPQALPYMGCPNSAPSTTLQRPPLPLQMPPLPLQMLVRSINEGRALRDDLEGFALKRPPPAEGDWDEGWSGGGGGARWQGGGRR